MLKPRPRPEQTVLYLVGVLLLASGLVHIVVWFVAGGSLEGPISWRKPILFGLSAGVTMLSMGWLVGKLRRAPFDFPLLSLFGIAMLVEVGLITVQQWRGVASHFNRTTPLDANILFWIESLILFATVVVFELTRRCFQHLRVASDMKVAIRGGMVLLCLSCILGFVQAIYGNQQISKGLPPEIFGKAGVMKFMHGVPMHAIQMLPILAWALKKLGVDEQHRLRAVICALTSTIAFTVFSLLQTFTGRARFDLWWLSTIALAAAAVLMLAALALGWLGAQPHPARRS